MESTFGERLGELLGAGGIDVVFGVPGGQTLPLYAAAPAQGRTQVVVRDERNAACAADAYARVSGKVGVCDATVGPGVTNLVSGLAEAYSSSIPILAIVADIATDTEHLRRRSVASQATQQRAVLEPVTKWVARVEHPAALDETFEQALRVAVTGRPGPVVLEIPEDVFTGAADASRPRSLSHRDFAYPRFRSAPDEERLAVAADLVRSAEKPLVLAGGGVLYGGAAEAVTALAREHQIPVATTINGKGAIDERDPLAAGVTGAFGTPGASIAVEEADVVVALGTKLDQISTHTWRLPTAEQTVIHVDADGEEIGRTRPVELGIQADARAFADGLRRELTNRSAQGSNWLRDLPSATPPATSADDPAVAPELVVAAVDRSLAPDDVLVCDASLASGWGAAHFTVKRSGVGMLAPRGLAGIGWSAGAGLGAAAAAGPQRRTVVLAGDGAWAYCLSEVETAVRLGYDITYVILNNATLAWIKHVEDQMEIPNSSQLGPIDFAAVARGMGATGTRATSIDEFDDALAAALDAPGPALVDVLTSLDASPIVGYGKVKKGVYL